MFVTNHVLAGATIGAVLRRHPVAAFAAGVVSHLAMDACPHWAPDPADPSTPAVFLRAARCDGCCGLAAMAAGAALAPGPARWATIAGMAGGAVVDLDKPAVHFFGVDPFPRWFAQLHQGIQREAPNRLPHELVVGALLAATALVALRGARS